MSILTWFQFSAACNHLITEASDRVPGEWRRCGCWNHTGEGYLVHTSYHAVPNRDSYSGLTETASHCVNSDITKCESDGECEFSSSSSVSTVILEHHVVYNQSYCVPMLLFSARDTSGMCVTDLQWLLSVVGCDRVSLLPPVFSVESVGLRDVISQLLHPVLKRIFFAVHPCRTAAFMARHLPVDCVRDEPRCSNENCTSCDHVTGSSYKYLVFWLSLVGPICGLTLPPTLVKSRA